MSQACTLEGCMANYFQATHFRGADQYQCEACAKRRGIAVKEAKSDATQTSRLVFHPPNLLVQVKRNLPSSQSPNLTISQSRDLPICSSR